MEGKNIFHTRARYSDRLPSIKPISQPHWSHFARLGPVRRTVDHVPTKYAEHVDSDEAARDVGVGIGAPFANGELGARIILSDECFEAWDEFHNGGVGLVVLRRRGSDPRFINVRRILWRWKPLTVSTLTQRPL
jgi:hypothetical protein